MQVKIEKLVSMTTGIEFAIETTTMCSSPHGGIDT